MDLPILRILQALIKLKEKACVHFYYKIERMKEKAAGFQLKRGKIFYKVFFQSSRLQDVLFSGLQIKYRSSYFAKSLFFTNKSAPVI